MPDIPLSERFVRTISVIGEAAFERLRQSRVIVFGVGGVGAACAEALARSGVGTIALVDHDRVAASNLNRQLIALHSTIGQQKTSACMRRLMDINPDLRVLEYPVFYDEETAKHIDFARFDAAADCLDTLAAKLLIARQGLAGGVYTLSCMGAGNRLDPSRLDFSDIYKSHTCPLARRMRKACREAGIPSLRVLFSAEEPVKAVSEESHGRHAPGSMAFVPPVAGMMMAGDIVRHLITHPNPPQAPG